MRRVSREKGGEGREKGKGRQEREGEGTGEVCSRNFNLF